MIAIPTVYLFVCWILIKFYLRVANLIGIVTVSLEYWRKFVHNYDNPMEAQSIGENLCIANYDNHMEAKNIQELTSSYAKFLSREIGVLAGLVCP